MKKYQKLSMEVVEIENTDIVTDSGAAAAENPAYATNYTPGVPGLPGHGNDGNADANCCN